MPEPSVDQVVAAFRLPPIVTDHLHSRFYAAKLAVYRQQLSELRVAYGGPSRIYLSTAIREALFAEARRDAESVAQTYARLAESEARRAVARGMGGSRLTEHLAAYMRERGRVRSALIARAELTAPRLDATVAFFRENGVEPEFDFVGPAPQCPICVALKSTNPHPIAEVLIIGTPHIACTHRWKGRVYSAARLKAGGLRPGTISAGRGEIAGIVGGQTLQQRFGGSEKEIGERILAGELRE